MSKTKTKLTAAIAMLVISAIMMTTASYAWFTISTNPEIKNLSTTVVTNETLEIALSDASHTAVAASTTGDSGNPYTWGNLVDMNDSDVTGWSSFAKTVRPAKLNATDASKINYPKYGDDGRITSLDGVLTTGNAGKGFGNLVDGNGNIYGYYVDYWLRSNVGGQVEIQTTGVDRGAGTDGAGSYVEGTKDELADALCVGFQVKGTGNITLATKTAVTGNSLKYTLSGNVVNLTANQETWVRMYVFIDGDKITNKSASIDGTSVTGTINVQFKITAVDNAMSAKTEAAVTA